jgi:outer membrane immunogenic protein
MRLLFRGLLLAGVASPAFAADIDNSWLRGSSSFPADSPPYQRWNGFYGGGQLSADFRGVNFHDSSGPAIGNIMSQDAILQMLPVTQMSNLPSIVKTTPSYGGFLGYNYQIDDVVLGFEANFNWANMSASAVEFQSRKYTLTYNSHVYAPVTLNVADSARATLNDYGSFRTRAGWAYGNFLPYVTAGVSVAQISTTHSVNVNYTAIDVTPQVNGVPTLINLGASYTQADQSHGKYDFGIAAGLGLDYALARNVFLRGEFEYLQFGPQNNIKMNTASARAGMGLKF